MEGFIDLVRELWRQKAIVEEMKERLSEASKKLEGMKSQVGKMMEALELEKQHVPECGTIYRQSNFSVKIPKTPEEKRLLFNWINEHKGSDVLQNMISIHSATLNSFYKEEMDIALKAGDYAFKVPGIEPPELYYTLGMRK